jgi:Tol biopolymer transport system component
MGTTRAASAAEKRGGLMTYGARRAAARWRAVCRFATRLTAVTALGALLALALAAAAEADGALNGRISFTSFRDGELGDIWTMNPDGTQLRKLTAGPLYDAQSDWSPDGQWLAFRRGSDGSRGLGVWKMDLYGANQRLLTQGDPAVPTQNATQPAWTPDGQGLLFRATLPPFPDSDVWAMDTEGSARHIVAHVPGEQLYPSYSPDMSRIAFTTPVISDDRAIFTMAPDGSDPMKVFDVVEAYDSAPNWSPDGSQIAFQSDQDGDMEIYVMNADGTDVRQLTQNTLHDEGPVWAPDGTRVAYTSGADNLNGDVWVMDADGTNQQQLMAQLGRDESPDWQPVPHTGHYRACGDVTHIGAGAYSVKAVGRHLDCTRAKALATRWSDAALAAAQHDPAEGASDDGAQDALRGFACRTSDAGYRALKVRCSHKGHGDRSRARSHRKSILFIWRDS